MNRWLTAPHFCRSIHKKWLATLHRFMITTQHNLAVDSCVRQGRSEPKPERSLSKFPIPRRISLQALLLASAALVILLLGGCKPREQRIQFPPHVFIEDFQTPLDRDLSALLLRIDRTKAGQFVSHHFVKPLCDDVNLAELTVGAVELRPGQFANRPDLTRVVDECARVLKMPRPRLYVTDSPSLRASSVSFTEPVIILPGRILKNFTDPSELRFIIGREMGHIQCGHTKWQPILDRIVADLGDFKRVPQQVGAIPLLPILKWSREAEMSADNAGLICCQNPKAAERVLAALMVGTGSRLIGEVNVDSLLSQRTDTAHSQFSELMLLWRQALRECPFVPDRIVQLRQYAASLRYERLWN